jgi:RNA-splicing ligase RtcB
LARSNKQNHFIELGNREDGHIYITVHTGSRNFGLKVAQHHQRVAEKLARDYRKNIKDAEIEALVDKYKQARISEAQLQAGIAAINESARVVNGMESLSSNLMYQYFYDMHCAQLYAELNRRAIANDACRAMGSEYFFTAESVHNYIDFEDGVIRKGAIRAYPDERLVIPINRTFGTIVGTGKGNREWNYSAPHGAGRTMSRSDAKELITQEEASQRMVDAGIYSSVDPQDEDDAAYKDPQTILESLAPTVDIEFVIRPLLNIK